jgi:hypothetical protein
MSQKFGQMSRYGAIAKALPHLGPQGKVFFVASSSSAFTGDLTQFMHPDEDGDTRTFTSLPSAITAAVASRGDVIVLLPGFTATCTGAGTITVNKAGVTIVSLGEGNARATISYSTAVSASFDITAANVTIDNVIFDMTGVDAITAGINVQAAGVTIRNCRIINASASAQATLCVLTNATANRFSFIGNNVTGTSDAGTTAAVRIVGGDSITVKDNFFSGAYSSGVGAVENLTTATTNCNVDGNKINNLTASSTKAMVFVAGSTGQISRNYMQILSGTAPITGAAMSWVGANYYAATIATAGTLI